MFLKLMVVILLSVLFLYVKINIKQWCNPAYIMVLYWAVNIIIALFVLGNSYQWYISGLIWIIIACAFFVVFLALGVIVAQKRVDSTIIVREKSVSKNSWKVIWLCVIIGLIRFGLEMRANGFSFQMFFNLDTLLEMNTTMAYSRYNGGGASNSMIMQIMLVFIYAGPLIGGYAFVYSFQNFERRLCIATFIPIVGSLLLNNGKSGLIASSMLWFSGYVTGYLDKYKKSPTIKLKSLFIVLSGGLVVIALLYISMMLRIGGLNLQTMTIVNVKFVSYALGHVPAFDYWFGNYASNIDYTYGKYTFLGIFQALGISAREQGVFSEMVYAGPIETNVYTMFRGIINDFGIYGGVAFFIFFGFIAGYAYKSVLNHHSISILAKVILAGTYFFISFSAFISVWTYVSYILAFFVFGVYLWLAKQKGNKKLIEVPNESCFRRRKLRA